MTRTTDDPVVTDYLARLRRAGSRLRPDELEDLWASVTEHLDAAAERGEPAQVALARLGTPEEIVAAYAGEAGPMTGVPAAGQGTDGAGSGTAWAGAPAAYAHPEPRLTGRDIAALVLLQGGGFLCGVGWLVGAVLLWMSDRWKWWEKLLGTLVVPGGLVTFAGLGLVAVSSASMETYETCSVTPVGEPGGPVADSCMTTTTSASPDLGLPLLLLTFLLLGLSFAVTAYLAWRARPGRAGSATA